MYVCLWYLCFVCLLINSFSRSLILLFSHPIILSFLSFLSILLFCHSLPCSLVHSISPFFRGYGLRVDPGGPSIWGFLIRRSILGSQFMCYFGGLSWDSCASGSPLLALVCLFAYHFVFPVSRSLIVSCLLFYHFSYCSPFLHSVMRSSLFPCSLYFSLLPGIGSRNRSRGSFHCGVYYLWVHSGSMIHVSPRGSIMESSPIW